MTSRTGWMQVVFTSDGSVERTGWRANWTSAARALQPNLPTLAVWYNSPDVVWAEVPRASPPLYLEVAQGYSAIAPSFATAGGGSSLTVSGFGFQPGRAYSCRFGNATLSVSSRAASMAGSDPRSVGDFRYFFLICPVPVWPADARPVSFWLELEGREVALYDFNASTAAPPARRESARLTLQFLAQWQAASPAFADRLGGVNSGSSPAITVTGCGFGATFLYRARFDGDAGAPGPSQNRTVYTSAAAPRSVSTIALDPPVWDNETVWGEYAAHRASMTLEESRDGSATWVGVCRRYQGVVCATATSSPADGGGFLFVDINRAPAFGGVVSWFIVRANSSRFTHPWIPAVFKGLPAADRARAAGNASALASAADTPTERSQALSFAVLSTPGSLFEDPPAVDAMAVQRQLL